MSPLAENSWRQIREKAAVLLKEGGLEMVDLEFRREGRGWVLRLFMDKPGGVTLEDCAAVSRELGDQIEAEDIIPFRYTLEVSSPGLDRPLKGAEDYRRNLGKLIQLTTASPIAGQSFFKGTLLDYRESDRLHLSDRDITWEIPVSLITKARLVFEG